MTFFFPYDQYYLSLILAVFGFYIAFYVSLKFIILDKYIIKKLDTGDGKINAMDKITGALSRDTTAFTVAALLTLFIIMLVFLINFEPIKVEVDPSDFKENITFSEKNNNFTREETIRIINLGQDLTDVWLKPTEISAGQNWIFPCQANISLKSSEVRYLSFKLEIPRNGLIEGVYRGDICIQAKTNKSDIYSTIVRIPIDFSYISAVNKSEEENRTNLT